MRRMARSGLFKCAAPDSLTWIGDDCGLRSMVALGAVTAVLALGGCGGGGGSGSGGSQAFTTSTITSEADTILHMDQLRAMGYRGDGVRVGVISTGVVNLASYQNAGLLPASLYVSQNTAGSLDEGSWMLQLVHQYAPDATLGFCDGTDLDFDGCIKDLANNFRADIVVDDILFSGQFYPDPTGEIVAQLEAANPNFVFVHLAGNEQNGGYWRGPFVASQAQIGLVSAVVLDFGLASGAASNPFNSVTVPAGGHLRLIVNWNDPPHGPANHALTAYLLDATGQVLTRASGQSDPTFVVDYMNSTSNAQTVRLAITLDDGSPTTGLAVQITEGSALCNIECQALAFSTSGLAGGSVGDFADSLVVGATMVGAPKLLEPWSNHGPFRIDFQVTADSTSPDGYDYTRLMIPLQVNKPDLVAPDCVTTPFSNGTTISNEAFCGTSAAVPGVAAAAALLESAGFNRARVLKALRSTAVPLGPNSWDPSYGFGLVDALAALNSGGN